MNIFTEYEKTVIISLLKLIMEADAVIHPLEEEYLNSILEEMCVSADLIYRYSRADLQSCIVCVGAMERQKKEFVGKILKGMSEADGYVDPRELALIDKILLSENTI